MSFENLSINRLIIHEVFARGADKALVQPTYGDQLLVLPQDARDALQARITNALGKSSHGVEMTIRETGADSTWNKAKEIIQAQGNDVQFVNPLKTLPVSWRLPKLIAPFLAASWW